MKQNLILKGIWLGVVLLLSLGAAGVSPGFANPPEPERPPGFDAILSAPGITLYRKHYPGGNPDYVQVIDLSQGAAVIPLHGDITETREGKGVFGGNDARFKSLTMGQYWRAARSRSDSAFCVTNGQFFYMKEYPTRLPFSLKKDGVVLTDGYDDKNFIGSKLMLELWDGYADIRELTMEDLYTSSAPDIIAGLSEEGNKAGKHAVGRTFVGVDDRNGDGWFETLLIFSTKTARQADAAQMVKNFGAEKVMMLDGGGSAQLLCQGTSYVASERPVPQALAVFAANVAEEQMAVVSTESDVGVEAVVAEAISPLETLDDPSLETIDDDERVTSFGAAVQALRESEPGNHPSMDAEAMKYYFLPAIQAEGGGSSRVKHLKMPVLDNPSSRANVLAARSPGSGTDFRNVLWVPLAMAPVMLVLVSVIYKLRMR